MAFDKEADFEEALIKMLTDSCGWEKTVLKYKTEKDLIRNWADILFENNRGIDRLNDSPLTDGEMQQIIEQIGNLKTPLKLNGFVNGKFVTIKRDNPNDKAHFGKEIDLKIYDRHEIAAGQSRYQIAQQPIFTAKTDILPDRRGDFILLINGMPLIHVELKKSGIPISQACNQIKKYSEEGVFTGLFALVQVFVAMNPEEAEYFANPGPEGKFNSDYYFHWADFNNEPINEWKQVASTLLSIPMAHQLIGFYTVADDTDGVLKVMRSYQYYAANKISDTVARHKWENGNQLGGYIWHTTGSGKTMTSFKSAQLIANSNDADKVVFLIDRIELGTQSAMEYRGFAEENEAIQETEDTAVLVGKLKSTNHADSLIVTSIQKMSNINEEYEALKKADLDIICSKRIVFIVDECHRSSFGDMMRTVKETFPKALFFGFSGTPIQIENEKKGNTTVDVFGNELHRYSIADGIRDKNVLGFDPDKVLTFEENKMREAVALEQARASSVKEALSDPKKSEIFYKYKDPKKVPMAGYEDDSGKYVKGIEDFLLKNGQYQTEEHQQMVVKDILDNWLVISHNNKFHGLFATSSIPEAMQYYHRFKTKAPDLKVAALFDPSIDNNGTGIDKEKALVEIIEDYNKRYNQTFTIPTFQRMKKDIQHRLAHKRPYERIENNPAEQIDLLIVVDQMLTGYDSKWLNVLYLDKMMKYENIIQAFSRTNRLFGHDKPFGSIKYYRAPYTMERNIANAVKLYSGDKPLGMFVDKLKANLENMNSVFTQIKNLFSSAGIDDFSKLPDVVAEKKQFAKLFNDFNKYLEVATVQGFKWDKPDYHFEENGTTTTVSMLLDEKTYKILALRYKELFGGSSGGGGGVNVPYDLEGHLTTINTAEIDADYMNSRFEKFRKALSSGSPDDIRNAKDELHKTFATLSQEEQKFANIFLHDIDTGDVIVQAGKSLRDYINQYISSAKNDQIHRLSSALGLDEQMLRDMMGIRIDESNINEYGRLESLKKTVDIAKAKSYFEAVEGKKIPVPKVNIKVDNLLRDFILSGGIDIAEEQ